LALYWLFSSGVGVKCAQSSSQWADTRKNVLNHVDTSITLLSQRELALTARNTLYAFIGTSTKFKNWPRPLFGPPTDHACHQKPNPSRETVPFNVTIDVLLFNKSGAK
jgi:hypothetical protein